MLHLCAVHSKMRVNILTVMLLSCLSGCALTQQYVLDRCKTRAYVRNIVPDYLSARFHSEAPVRMAIIPFSPPANLAYRGPEVPGLGNLLASQIHSELVAANQVPIVELFNRQDWPGKKDEFSTGNFGAIRASRDAGYDLVLVGKMLPMQALDSISVEYKLIEVEAGITLWYGVTTARTFAQGVDRELSNFGMGSEVPANLGTNELASEAARCIAKELSSEDEGGWRWPWQ
jgi:hypothetical protein